jgi:hypothetical protein
MKRIEEEEEEKKEEEINHRNGGLDVRIYEGADKVKIATQL